MDLQALTNEQLQLTFRLGDILSMQDLTLVAAALSSFDWNIETALAQMQVGPAKNNPVPPPTVPTQLYNYNSNEEYSYENGQNQNFEQQENNEAEQYQYLFNQKKKMFEEQYISLIPLQRSLSQPNKELAILQNHKLLANSTRAHREEYLIQLMKKSQSLCKNILQSNKESTTKYYQNRRKIQNNRSFINFLYHNYQPNVNFTFGTFFLNLTRSYLQNKFLLVYIHSVTPEVQKKFEKVVQLILRQKQIARFVNQNCITYGMFDNSDDYQQLQKYIPLKDLPAFALFRLNKAKRIEQFISSYKVSTQGEMFLEWAAKSMGISLQKKQAAKVEEKEKAIKQQIKKEQIKKQKEQAHAQAQLKQQKQFIAHKDIRKEQDQLYAQLQESFKIKRLVSLDRKQQQKYNQQQLQKRIAQAISEIQPEAGPNIMEIRFRMPISGQSKSRHFLLQQKIQKMFRYVDCFCRDEFEQKFNQFDLRQSFPPLSLLDKRDKLIGEIFQGSNRQNIIVRQL